MARPRPGLSGEWDVGNAKFHEIHGALVTMDPGHAISTGLIDHSQAVLKFGHNPDVDTAAQEEVNHFGNLTRLTAASTFTIVSDAAADDMTTGSGAWEVVITYLDENYEQLSITYDMDGITPVVTTETGLRIQSAYCGRCGSGGENAGNITITATTGGSTQAYIRATDGQTDQSAYTVPAGYNAYFIAGHFSIAESGGRALKETSAFLNSQVRIYDETSTNNYQSWRTLFEVLLNNRGTGSQYLDQPVHNPIPEKTDIRFNVTVDANDTQATARLFIILREN